MELRFELEAADLELAHLTLTEGRRRRAMRSRWTGWILLFGASAMTWPITAPLFDDADPSAAWLRPVVFLVAVVITALSLPTILRLTERVPMRGLEAWSARRTAERGARHTVFGPVTIRFDDEIIRRTNSVDSVELSYSRVDRILRTPEILVLVLNSPKRLLAIPSRAFAAPSELVELAGLVSRRATSAEVVELDPAKS